MTETVGIIVCGDAPEELAQSYGSYADMFMNLLRRYRSDLQFRVFEAFRGDLPDSPAGSDIWLLTGSRFSVLDDAPWIRALEAFVRDIVAAQKRLIGICFGHQLIAQALGGRVARSGWLAGRQAYALMADNRQPVRAIAINAFHEDQVVTLPENARVTAGSDSCPYGVLEYGSSVITTQAHPEFSDDFVKELIRYRLADKVSDEKLDDFLTGLETPLDGDAVRALVFAPLLAAVEVAARQQRASKW